MDKEKGLLLYHQQDMRNVMDFLNSLTITGVEAARRLCIVATIIETGKPQEEKEEGEEDGAVRQALQPDNVER